MHSRNRNGWAGIVGPEESADDHEHTDPNLELPSFAEVGADDETTVDESPTLPPGTNRKQRLTLPRPASELAKKGTPALEFPVQVDELVQKLEPDRSKDTPAKRSKDAKLFTTEVVLTIIGGVLLLGGTLAYTHNYDDEASTLPRPMQVQPMVAPKAAPVAAPVPVPIVEPAVVAEPAQPPPVVVEQPRKAATPLLSILSNPSGARVEINGTIYGNTPLIQPGPDGLKSLSIRLLKDNYKPYEAVLTANDAGHFNLNATLDKR